MPLLPGRVPRGPFAGGTSTRFTRTSVRAARGCPELWPHRNPRTVRILLAIGQRAAHTQPQHAVPDGWRNSHLEKGRRRVAPSLKESRLRGLPPVQRLLFREGFQIVWEVTM